MTKTSYRRNGQLIDANKELKLLSFVNGVNKVDYNCASIGIVEVHCTYNENKKKNSNEFFGFYNRTGEIAGSMDKEEKRDLLKAQRRSKF